MAPETGDKDTGAKDPGGSSRPDQIADRIVDAILAGRLAPGQRRGAQALGDMLGGRRTQVGEGRAPRPKTRWRRCGPRCRR
jgi:DNA-binding GntR family transcriptional regulator